VGAHSLGDRSYKNWITDETGIGKKLVAIMSKIAMDTPEINPSNTII